MLSCIINEQVELHLLQRQHSRELAALLEANRPYLRRWHPWVDLLVSQAHCETAINAWQRQHADNRGFHCGIWFRGNLCGAINHLNVDWANRSTALSYWLDAGHQ
jgi:ribosomal-protein-serine acetyltransferase